MNYTINLSELPIVEEGRKIIDIEIFRQYCTNFYQWQPMISFGIIFLSITIFEVFISDKINERWKANIWTLIIFMVWAFSLMNVILMVVLWMK
jgi:hypothetical protein